LLFAKNCFGSKASFPLEEQPRRAKLKICTEADFLQAHLTFIAGESGCRNPAFHNLKKWLTSVLKKWIPAARGSKHNVDAGNVGELPSSLPLCALIQA
jgi:hypothetical protein